MIIKVRNLLDDKAQYSFLSFGEASGVTSLRIKNINAFQASWAVQIGKTGEEQAEIKILGTATPSGTALTLATASTYDHPSDTPVYAIKYDKLIFKRSTSGTAGTATAITNGTVAITPDSTYTQFDDTSAADGYAYKASFYNSITTEETADSDWLTTDGFPFDSLAALRQRVKNKLFSSRFVTQDAIIDDWLNEWLDDMDQAAIKVNKEYLIGTANVAFGTNGFATISANDFVELKRVWIAYNSSEKYKATKKDLSEVYPNETFTMTHPYYSWRGDTVFQVLPAESGGTAELIYYARSTKMSDDGDQLPYVMRPYSASFVNYALSEAYYLDNSDAAGDRFFQKALQAKQDFVNQITPRNFTGVQMMQLTNEVFGEGEVYW